MTRSEVFLGAGPTPATRHRVKIGARKDGHLTAAEAHLLYGVGSYSSVTGGGGGGRQIFAPYDIPNAYIEITDVVVNKPPSVGYRAPAAHVGGVCRRAGHG